MKILVTLTDNARKTLKKPVTLFHSDGYRASGYSDEYILINEGRPGTVTARFAGAREMRHVPILLIWEMKLRLNKRTYSLILFCFRKSELSRFSKKNFLIHLKPDSVNVNIHIFEFEVCFEVYIHRFFECEFENSCR